MAIEYLKKTAVLDGHVGVEDAETLLEWLLKNPKSKLNLSTCEHLHSANLQVLMTVKPGIASWPKNTELRLWLESALKKL